MTYAEARDLADRGELKRKVLTERGWVLPKDAEETKPEPVAKPRTLTLPKK